ncbi:MAG: NAD-dependent dehydratase, partial [bacterium (Candidatus Ratteibacteria) CG01_land_8_20_14_3_00_40_19]
MKIKDEKILVTGAGGFIGSHLTEKLVKEGAKVKAFVRYNSRNDSGMLEMLPARIRKNIEIIAGDLRDTDAVRKAI